MQRTIEKLAGDRRRLEERFQQQVDSLKAAARAMAALEGRFSAAGEASGRKSGLFAAKPSADSAALGSALAEGTRLAAGLADSTAALLETVNALSDVRDKEWDALGNNHLSALVQGLESRVERLAAASEDAVSLSRTFVLLQDQLGRLLASLQEKHLPTPAEVGAVLEPIRDWRYTRFENRHRGSREEIRSQLERYLEYFKAGGEILDLGCGRGEFLELLRDRGFRGTGVDLNAQMVESCRGQGLQAERGDLLDTLAGRADASLDGIFSAQVIEHLPAAALERLVELAQAKLAPGGVVILETINPTSVYALVHAFYADLSHRFPVHPEALRFLLDAAGFEKTEILYSGRIEPERLDPVPGTGDAGLALNQDIDKLNRLLFGAPNYAAVARKS
ncbi:MAG: class I SAM-dependent methyltransferase [Candidatus Aminicenantes bacterium]|nr:class I SAM-dependent methyltransferase [Candidatus Aminicenantes bacterium]